MSEVPTGLSLYWLSCVASDLQAAGKWRSDHWDPDTRANRQRELIPEARGLNHLATLLSTGPTTFDQRERKVSVSMDAMQNYLAISVFSSTSAEGGRRTFLVPAITPEEDKEFLQNLLRTKEGSISLKDLSFNDFDDFTNQSMRLLNAAAAHIRQDARSKEDVISPVSQFFVHACQEKLTGRLRQLCRHYQIDEMLTNWTPSETYVAPGRIVIKDKYLSKFFVGLGIKQDEKNPDVLLFNVSTAALWWKAICSCLGTLVHSTLPDSGTIELHSVAAGCELLHRFVRLVPALWRIPSLDVHLEACRIVAEKRYADEKIPEDRERLMEDVLPTDTSFPRPMYDEIQRFYCALDSICAWTSAVRYLLSSRVVRTPFAIHMSIVDLPKTTMPPISADALIERWIGKGMRFRPSITSRLERYLKKRVTTKDFVCMQYHSEAGLMASYLYNATNLKDAAAREPACISGAFEVEGPPTSLPLGVPTMCCPLCTMFRNSIGYVSDLKVHLPGNHNRFVPWVPPEWVPEEVLRNMENCLIALIWDMMGGTRIGRSPPPSRSPSPPPGLERAVADQEGSPSPLTLS